MIVDAGSTGSRLFIYDVSGSKVVRVGSEKTTPGLSCFVYGCNPDKYPTPTDQYMKLVRYANEIIPVELRGKTEITVKATAGMRLLSEEDQDAIYASLLSGLTSHPDFHYKIGSISTLRGDLEGYYGLVSSNHLLTSDSAGGDTKGYSGNEGYRPVGSLDMGGSSTQITFLPGDRPDHDMDLIKDRNEVFERLYVHSYLGYGADTFREGMWDGIIEGGGREVKCAFKGWRGEWKGKEIVGTGDAEGCREVIVRRLEGLSEERGGGGGEYIDIDGVRHPRVRGRFIGMSLYFFALDCLRHVGGDDKVKVSWPRPSMKEVLSAAVEFCATPWDELENKAETVHKFTRTSGLPHRCFEAVYIASILRDAYGFEEDWRRVEFRFDIGGEEVEWTRGMVMVEEGGGGQ